MEVNLETSLCYKLFHIVKLNEQLIDREMEQFNLSRTQWKVIARFNFLPIPCTQQQLLISMGIDRAHLTRTLDQLETRGFILRKRLTADKRAYNVFPTKSGEQLLNKIEMILHNESDCLTKGLSRNEKTILKKFIDKIELNVADELEKLK